MVSFRRRWAWLWDVALPWALVSGLVTGFGIELISLAGGWTRVMALALKSF